jgi:hypothetical protein
VTLHGAVHFIHNNKKFLVKLIVANRVITIYSSVNNIFVQKMSIIQYVPKSTCSSVYHGDQVGQQLIHAAPEVAEANLSYPERRTALIGH